MFEFWTLKFESLFTKVVNLHGSTFDMFTANFLIKHPVLEFQTLHWKVMLNIPKNKQINLFDFSWYLFLLKGW